MLVSELLKLRDAIIKGSASLSDEDAVTVPELFDSWKVGVAYAKDTRLAYDGKLYKVVQAHTSQSDWTPDKTPALYTDVAKPGEIPVWKQPTGAQDAYNKGDKVHYPTADDPVYESLIDANVWSPEVYPDGWKKVS